MPALLIGGDDDLGMYGGKARRKWARRCGWNLAGLGHNMLCPYEWGRQKERGISRVARNDGECMARVVLAARRWRRLVGNRVKSRCGGSFCRDVLRRARAGWVASGW